MNPVNSTTAKKTNQAPSPVNWKAKYEKEHQLKKNLNKKKKKAYKRIKKLNKQTQTLKEELMKLKTTSFIRDHDYF